jgi:hypothetical protein
MKAGMLVVGLVSASLGLSAAGAWAASSGRDAEIEQELMSLDPATRNALVREMIGRMDSPAGITPNAEAAPLPAPTPAAATAVQPGAAGNPAGEVPAAGFSAFSPNEVKFFLYAAGIDNARFIAASSLTGRLAEIVAQPQHHLMITVGDVVLLATPGFTLPAESRCLVYKKLHRRSGDGSDATWLVPAGKVKIRESNPSLTVASVVAASDVIQVGDVVLVSGE